MRIRILLLSLIAGLLGAIFASPVAASPVTGDRADYSTAAYEYYWRSATCTISRSNSPDPSATTFVQFRRNPSTGRIHAVVMEVSTNSPTSLIKSFRGDFTLEMKNSPYEDLLSWHPRPTNGVGGNVAYRWDVHSSNGETTRGLAINSRVYFGVNNTMSCAVRVTS